MSVHVEELVTAFLQNGHEVLVVGPSFYERTGFGGESRTFALIRRLSRACRAFQPDLIYERTTSIS